MESTELWRIRKYTFYHYGGTGFYLQGPFFYEVWVEDGCIMYATSFYNVPKDVRKRVIATVRRMTGAEPL